MKTSVPSTRSVMFLLFCRPGTLLLALSTMLFLLFQFFVVVFFGQRTEVHMYKDKRRKGNRGNRENVWPFNITHNLPLFHSPNKVD